jgi:AcrR family transcriptional regulator
VTSPPHLPALTAASQLRRAPKQKRAQDRIERLLDAADELLARDGAEAFSTVGVAELAGISIGSLYHWFGDKEAIVEALAVRYWGQFEALVAHVAEADGLDPDGLDPLFDPAGAMLDALAAGFRARPGFRALWYGGLRTERVRDATRPTRAAVARTLERVLATRWPASAAAVRTTVARTVVLIGDGLLREAFRVDPDGQPELLEEGKRALEAYVRTRLAG